MSKIRFVNKNEVFNYVRTELLRRRNEKYQTMEFDEVLDLVKDALAWADSVELEEECV